MPVTTRPRLFVTLEGYAVEGGYDQAGGPGTCYAPILSLGRLARANATDDLWHDYEKVLDFVPDLGFEGVRLNVEWARVEPRRASVDDGALRRYHEVIRYARSLGLEVTVALVDAVWPSWLGPEAWLLPWVVPHVLEHARRVVTTFNGDVTGVVAFTMANELVNRGYLEASAPPWRRHATNEAAFARVQLDGLIEALRVDDVVGPRLVRSFAVVALDAPPDDVLAARGASAVDELYVRSLVRGSGPTAVGSGLLVKDANEWRVTATSELLGSLR